MGAGSADIAQKVIWKAQAGPQAALIACPIFEVFYGGARGGGKTEASIGDWLEHQAAYGDKAIGVFFRRKFKQLEEVVARTKQLFPQIGARYREQPHAEWTMANGARLKFRYLERDSDAEEYQGHSYTRVYVEEATNFPSPRPINMLRATLRSAAGVPCGMRLTGNPGGPGHNWVKARYIDPNPAGYQVFEDEFSFQGQSIKLPRVFIPSRIADNPLLLRNDPQYVGRLYQVGSAALVKAWLDGDWDAIEGAFFSEFDEGVHVLHASWASRIPPHAMRYRAFDWGSAKPFSVGWYALSDGTWGLPKDALFKYREWYGCDGPNTGLKMDATMVAAGIRELEKREHVRFGVADPSIFIRDGGPSIAELMMSKGVQFRRADNKRRAGWEQLHCRLKGNNYGTIHWEPLLFFSDQCEHTIRTLPVLQHDDVDAEDVDTDGEDHAGDETRYAVMARPWQPKTSALEPDTWLPPKQAMPTINAIVERAKRRRLAAQETDL